jgi:S-adenosyl methyltransferase
MVAPLPNGGRRLCYVCPVAFGDEVGAGGPARRDDQPPFDTSIAHQARIYDYWLGGKDNYAADRKAAEAAIAAYPGVATGARANRQFLARVVRHLAGEAGIRQFLDIGTGIPTANNTHEVAQSVGPDSRVVYVDYDPVVLIHARALLASRHEGLIDYLDADLRGPEAILDQASRTLDFSRPVAIMLIAILHAIGDQDDPYQIVARLIDAMPAGSYLAISHVASDIDPEKIAEATARLNQLSHQHFTLRNHAEVTRFFGDLELLEPGVVRVEEWRPASELEGRNRSAVWGGVARKR